MTEPSRIAGFLCVTDTNGIRHAIRLQAICCVRDADLDRAEAVIVANNGKDMVAVGCDMERIVDVMVRGSGGIY